jgi:hypothetical protein
MERAGASRCRELTAGFQVLPPPSSLPSLYLPLVVQRTGWPLRSGPRSSEWAAVDLPLRDRGGEVQLGVGEKDGGSGTT